MKNLPKIERVISVDKPRLSICVCHITSRHKKLGRLLNILRGQLTDAVNLPVEVLVAADGGEHTSGSKRHALSLAAKGDYISFIDDDDTVSDNYAEIILEGSKDDPEVITFYVLIDHQDVVGQKPHYRLNIHTLDVPHDLVRRGVQEHPDFGHLVLVGMWPSHINAWRRDVQRKVAYHPELNCLDDAAWIEPLMTSGLVTTEKHIEEILYTYEFSQQQTINQKPERQRAAKNKIDGGWECFKRYNAIYIATESVTKTCHQDNILCRDCDNTVVTINRSEATKYHVFKSPFA